MKILKLVDVVFIVLAIISLIAGLLGGLAMFYLILSGVMNKLIALVA